VNAAELREKLRDWWNVPDRYLDCRFDNFEVYDGVLESRLSLVRKVATERRSVLLFGRPGVGKTHLAIAVMSEWVSRGAKGHFVAALEYTLRVQSAFGNPKEIADDLLDDANFLVLDDTGTERENETSRLALLYLVDRAYANRKRMVVTSNLTPDELNKFEPRVVSRLTEMGPLIGIKADDYRLRIAADRRKTDLIEGVPRSLN
jgi:DNA replication protein DnaC